jgi:hypothetical protein
METISLTRKTLYDQIWTESVAAFCLKYDVHEVGVEEICRRPNVPMPDNAYWRKLKQGKRADWMPLPTGSRGTETVVLSKRNDTLQKEEHMKMISGVLEQVGGSSINLNLLLYCVSLYQKPFHLGYVQALGSSTKNSGAFGVSWTLSKAVAEFHAYKYQGYTLHQEDEKVIQSIVDKNKMIAYFNGPKEKEIIYTHLSDGDMPLIF